MSAHLTFCALRLGDNLAHLHFLRSLAKAHPRRTFIHAAHAQYLPQLEPLVEDLGNLSLCSLALLSEQLGPWWQWRPADDAWVDAWKNAGGAWESDPDRNNYAGSMLRHFHRLAGRMGLESAFHKPFDLLFDYPALLREPRHSVILGSFDVLFVNAQPMSGQWRGFSGAALNALASRLRAMRLSVVTTHDCGDDKIPSTTAAGYSVTEIGSLSRRAKAIVAVSTGPSWPTFNVWNASAAIRRVILIDSERIEIAPNTAHTSSVDQVLSLL